MSLEFLGKEAIKEYEHRVRKRLESIDREYKRRRGETRMDLMHRGFGSSSLCATSMWRIDIEHNQAVATTGLDELFELAEERHLRLGAVEIRQIEERFCNALRTSGECAINEIAVYMKERGSASMIGSTTKSFRSQLDAVVETCREDIQCRAAALRRKQGQESKNKLLGWFEKLIWLLIGRISAFLLQYFGKH